MPPEQAEGLIDQVDERADVFALGSILCEILTGGPAYAGRNRDGVRRKALRGDLSDAHRRLDESGADPDLVTLAKECLTDERLDRPRDASTVAKRIAAHLEEVQDRLKKAEIAEAEASARAEAERTRRKLAVALGAVVVVAIIALGWATLVQPLVQRAAMRADGERAAREKLIDNHLDTANLALQRGDWATALGELDAARDAGRPEVARTRLDRVKGLDGLNRITDAIDALKDLTVQVRDGRLAATPSELALTQLCEAELLSGRGPTEQARTLALLRALVESPLPRAEGAYASGLIARNVKDAEARFREALQLDPYHRRARLTLVVTLMLSGKARDARLELGIAAELFRDDPNVGLLRVIHHAILGEFAEARAELEKIKPAPTPALSHAANTVIDALEEITAGASTSCNLTSRSRRESSSGCSPKSAPSAPNSTHMRSLPWARRRSF